MGANRGVIIACAKFGLRSFMVLHMSVVVTFRCLPWEYGTAELILHYTTVRAFN
jgi:hypothetical protein